MSNCAECGKPLGSAEFICHTCQREIDLIDETPPNEEIEELIELGLVRPSTKDGEPAIELTEAGRRVLDRMDDDTDEIHQEKSA